MVSKKSIAILVSAAVFTCVSQVNAVPANTQSSSAQQVQEVVSHLNGAMDTSAQARANPNAPNVRMTTCKVKVKNAAAIARPHAVFMYQEQALSQRLSQPYRQRFLRIAPSVDNNSIESAVFRPPTPQAWIGLCNKPEAQRIIDVKDIGTSNCSVFLRRQQQNYIGETSASGCPSNYKGAVRITNRITLHQAGMDTWDRGFDAAGNQVWGAQSEAYQFRWIRESIRSRFLQL
ncbi:chromophore lyase CpcT/CpeT [Gloeocapsopsis crepidinum LEGE 06123]|uniref:Chromophore lyase CpcT/CpeT n=1 Tax=Gloeocapsopsis crepidinum LEGE 06123 TaxID=588587 RepID=A0ABR9UZC1_9CHRO|nr:chromophore lyase CpcT/CpeT [Gloeocapsopsis crepidinum]MBE9193626.1 chromophore lyase CpcT/CpeT [Gloeocapsopsis crepidinum LEGE 06123]